MNDYIELVVQLIFAPLHGSPIALESPYIIVDGYTILVGGIEKEAIDIAYGSERSSPKKVRQWIRSVTVSTSAPQANSSTVNELVSTSAGNNLISV